MKRCLVLGGAGFIGVHLVNRLVHEGFWVKAVDIAFPRFGWITEPDVFQLGDLRDPNLAYSLIVDQGIDDIYQLAADMGGAGFIFSGKNDADIIVSNTMINMNVLHALRPLSQTSPFKKPFRFQGRLFYASSACVYPEWIPGMEDGLRESLANPTTCDSDYGKEKWFAEQAYLAARRNWGIDVKIARFHNIFGPYSVFEGGREKAPAALCRKVIEAEADLGEIEIWGDGKQLRSFLYIDECIEGVRRLMQSEFNGPVNIGSSESVSIAELAAMICGLANKTPRFRFMKGPTGAEKRNSDNTLIQARLKWAPSQSLFSGLTPTFRWISDRIRSKTLTQA
ncbi:MAG: NAD-dependent dehydratase [Verrucomicrobia bacterium]|nr:MAG: NAD-dependent dehydratase [Verrucomicrobiota bacterium]